MSAEKKQIAARQAAFPYTPGTRLVYWVHYEETGRWKRGAIQGIYEILTEESRQQQRNHVWIGEVGEGVIRRCDEKWNPLPQYERLHMFDPDPVMLARWRPDGVDPNQATK